MPPRLATFSMRVSGRGLQRLVLLSIAGVGDPTFDQFDYYLAKLPRGGWCPGARFR